MKTEIPIKKFQQLLRFSIKDQLKGLQDRGYTDYMLKGVVLEAKNDGLSSDDVFTLIWEELRSCIPGLEEHTLIDLLDSIYTIAPNVQVESNSFTGTALLETEFPPTIWVIEKILPEGLAILAAPPKTGKSGLCLHLAASIATGSLAMGRFKTDPGSVLYFALEDSPRRIKDRLAKMQQPDSNLQNMIVAFEHPTINEDGLSHLEGQITSHPGCKLVILDTYARVSPAGSGRKNAYDNDYKSLAPLQSLAMKHHLCIIIVTHFRKEESDDILHKVMGSTGMTGVADTILVLKRKRGGTSGSLYITGRDVEEEEYALRFAPDKGFWVLEGKAHDILISRERQELLDALKKANRPMSPKEVAEALGKSPENIKVLMPKMVSDGQLKKTGYGRYAIVGPQDYFDYSEDENI